MRIFKSALKVPQTTPTSQAPNTTTTVSNSIITTNASLSGGFILNSNSTTNTTNTTNLISQVDVFNNSASSSSNSGNSMISQSDFDSFLEMDSTAGSGGNESFTLYKSDVDEIIQPKTTTGAGESEDPDDVLAITDPDIIDIYDVDNLREFEEAGQDNTNKLNGSDAAAFDDDELSELRQEMLKPVVSNRRRALNVNEVSENFSQDQVTQNLSPSVADHQIPYSAAANYINSTSSISFTISIPPTSTSPGTTMYLPFTNRKKTPVMEVKSHHLEATNLNCVPYIESNTEKETRKNRVHKALAEEDWSNLNLKYFVEKNVEQYLEKRGYMQPYMRVPKVITKGIFASIISLENSASNSITFGPQYEPDEIIGEIERFWKFYLRLKGKKPSMSAELKQVLIPMLLYFYLECFISGLVPVALRLYVEFSKKFLTEDATQDSYDILFSIATITSPDAFDDNELLQAFRQQEYKFVLSQQTFDILQKFVASSTSPLMMHLFSNRFTIQLKETTEIAEQFVDLPCPEPQRKKRVKSVEASEVSEVIKRLRENPGCDLPSLSVYLTNWKPLCGAASPDMIAFGMSNGAGIRLGFRSKKCLNSFKSESDSKQNSLKMMNYLRGHSGSVYATAFHPTTERLYSGGEDCKLKVWDLKTMSCKGSFDGHMLPLTAIDIPESGHMIATASLDKTARLWLPERPDDVRLFVGHHFHLTSVKFHPNEAYLATGSQDSTARLWSISDGSIVRVFTGFQGRVSDVVFHESGKYILAGGADSFIRIWDIGEGELLAELPSPPNCSSLALYRDTLAASFDGDSTVRLWNLRKVIHQSNMSEAEKDESEFELPRPFKSTCVANSLLKLQFMSDNSLVAVGEKYSQPKAKSEPENKVEKDKPEAEPDNVINPNFTAPQYSSEWFDEVAKVLPEINLSSSELEGDAFSDDLYPV